MAWQTCAYPGCGVLVVRGYCEKHATRKRFCSFPGCGETVTESNYCEKHQPRRLADSNRHGATFRGYGYAWSRLAKAYMKANPLCEACLELGLTTPAVLVHHILPLDHGGELLSWDNLRALCSSCHTQAHRELGDFRNTKK